MSEGKAMYFYCTVLCPVRKTSAAITKTGTLTVVTQNGTLSL
jgi:hypothetical protein